MRIDGESSGIPLYGRRTTRSGAAAGSRRTPSTPSSSGSVSHEPSELMTRLQSLPEVRSDVMEEVRQRLERGELLTREAAEATANAILADLQCFLSP